MNKAKILGIVVTVTGAAVMAGWILDIAILKSIMPHWVTMKFSTALSFLLSGVTLYCIAGVVDGRMDAARIVLPLTTLLVLLLMATLLASTLLRVRTGIEDLFVKEAEGAVRSVTPGRPSVGTMIDFILVALCGVLAMLDIPYLKTVLRSAGTAVFAVGAAAIAGYVLNRPLLYYTIPDISTAMAIHTAILFSMLGIGLYVSGKAR